MDKEIAKERIAKLMQEFSEYPRERLNNKSEDQIRAEFIDPLFEALGWDMRKDAERNEWVLKGKADYILRIGNENKLVIEAKKTDIALSEKEGIQTVSYANHSKITFAVLTNFKEIKVYHALNRTPFIDSNLLKFEDKSVFRIPFEKFLEYFDKLWLLSKESFEKGEINKLLSRKDERTAKPVDESILIDLLNIRDWLSKELKSKRTQLSQEQIDEAVQILIDRLIFMRSVEDRGLEEKEFLLNLVKKIEQGLTDKNLWALLKIQFKIFDKEYNSKLFAQSLLEEESIFFDNDKLIVTIKGLYFGTGKDKQLKYEFDLISSDLLGSIYEQYLGTVLQGTEKRVKLESKSGKRKKMGIYYTPAYIVDYIVKNTVGEYIKDKTIDEILEVKILDPACGSGSFLTRAFQEVANVIEEKLKKREKSKSAQFSYFKDRLDLGQKSSILERCIYGVDLDEKAVELTQLNLLLKILEGETRETRRKILPNMKDNIQGGNSLIDDYKISDKAFNWNSRKKFSDVMKQGGFDVVVGNPPYGADLKTAERNWLENKYEMKNTDTAVLFMSLAKNLVNEEGLNGFIIPKSFVYSAGWKEIRKALIEGLTNLVDCGKVWKEVLLEQIVYIYHKNKIYKTYNSLVREKTTIKNIGEIDKKTAIEFGFLLNGISEEELSLGEKIRKAGSFLNDYFTNSRGAIYQKYLKPQQKSKSDMKAIGGKQIGRYLIKEDVKGFIPKEEIKDEKAIIKLNSILVQRIIAHIENPKEHIEIMSSSINILNSNQCIIVDTINQLTNKGKVNYHLFLAILNSKLMSWYAYRFIFGKAIRAMSFDNPVSANFPVPVYSKIDKKQEKRIIELVDQMLSLQKQLHEKNLSGNEKERLEQQIKNIDYEIDQEVYKLYGLTKDEIEIVEESLK